MSPKITQEQRDAILANPDCPVEIEDDQTKRIYVLVPKDGFRRMVDDALRRELQIGFDQADAGDVADWDIEEILAEARRRHGVQAS
jgi:hypothetical protein